jgi:hypothetical protein
VDSIRSIGEKMKRIFLSLLFVSFASICFAGEFEVKTGYGYFKDSQGNIVSKAELPKGKHLIKDGYIYVEVKDKEAINTVKTFEPIKTKEEEEKIEKEKLIQDKVREFAIEELKKDGKLDADEKPVK